jgi:hypothetical protein
MKWTRLTYIIIFPPSLAVLCPSLINIIIIVYVNIFSSLLYRSLSLLSFPLTLLSLSPLSLYFPIFLSLPLPPYSYFS